MEIKQTNKREKKAKEIYEVLPLLFDHKIIIIGKKEGERAKDLMMMMMIFVRENIKKKMKKIIVYHTHTHTLFLCPNKQTKKCNSWITYYALICMCAHFQLIFFFLFVRSFIQTAIFFWNEFSGSNSWPPNQPTKRNKPNLNNRIWINFFFGFVSFRFVLLLLFSFLFSYFLSLSLSFIHSISPTKKNIKHKYVNSLWLENGLNLQL